MDSAHHPGEIRTRGRPKSPYILRNVKMAFKSEAEYRKFLKHSTPAMRTYAVMKSIEKLELDKG